MSLKKTLKREVEVATSKDAQPAWFRIMKYLVLFLILYFFWGTRYLWMILLALLIIALTVHFWYRYKTRGWTRTYGLWKHESDRLNKTTASNK